MFTVQYKPQANTMITFDAATDIDIVESMSLLQEVMSETECKRCNNKGGEGVRFQTRTVGKYTFYEMKCKDCNASLAFGQNEKKQLFPRRYEVDGQEAKRDKEGNKVWLPNKGWVKFGED